MAHKFVYLIRTNRDIPQYHISIELKQVNHPKGKNMSMADVLQQMLSRWGSRIPYWLPSHCSQLILQGQWETSNSRIRHCNNQRPRPWSWTYSWAESDSTHHLLQLSSTSQRGPLWTTTRVWDISSACDCCREKRPVLCEQRSRPALPYHRCQHWYITKASQLIM